MSSSTVGMSFSDRMLIVKHETTCAAIVIADVLDGRTPTEADWQRLVLVLQRLRALLGE